jgi:hypothetical protein
VTFTEQGFCPVTGEKLGSRGPAVRVDLVTEVAEKPSFFLKCSSWFRAKEPPNRVVTTVYVCCPECVAKAKTDPARCILNVYADRRGLARCGPATASDGR